MIQDKITKMYKHITNKERAILTLGHMANNNTLEIERITSSAPQKIYRCIEKEYFDWIEGLINMGMLWGIEYWKLYSTYLANVLAFRTALSDSDRQLAIEVHAGITSLEAKLVALEKALKVVCTHVGIDSKIILRFGEVEPMTIETITIKPDVIYQKKTEMMLLRILPYLQN